MHAAVTLQVMRRALSEVRHCVTQQTVIVQASNWLWCGWSLQLVETYWSTPVNWVRGQVKAVAIAIMGKGLELAWRGGVLMVKALIKAPWS